MSGGLRTRPKAQARAKKSFAFVGEEGWRRKDQEGTRTGGTIWEGLFLLTLFAVSFTDEAPKKETSLILKPLIIR